MAERDELTPHEAGTAGRFTPNNAAEMGARGAAKREQNLRDRATQTRQELAAHAEEAARTLGAILTSDARDADKVKAAVAILDRVGVGPHSSQEHTFGPSLIEQWAAELEEQERVTAGERARANPKEAGNPGLPFLRALPENPSVS